MSVNIKSPNNTAFTIRGSKTNNQESGVQPIVQNLFNNQVQKRTANILPTKTPPLFSKGAL